MLKYFWQKDYKIYAEKGWVNIFNTRICCVYVIFVLLIFLGIVAYYINTMSVNKYLAEDINHIDYAKPTQEVNKFDIEKHIDDLPSIKYEKVNYDVKNTYTYEFNNYILTIDIPEGFEVRNGKINTEKVIDSTSIKDSCERYGLRDVCSGPSSGSFSDSSILSDTSICVSNNFSTEEVCSGEGIEIAPYKSKYKGVSLRDIFVKLLNNFTLKYADGDSCFFVKSDSYPVAEKLLSDNQKIMIYPIKYKFSSTFSRDLYFSILGSIKIQEKDN